MASAASDGEEAAHLWIVQIVCFARMDDPAAIQPTLHYWDSKRLPWLKFADGLQVFPELPPQG